MKQLYARLKGGIKEYRSVFTNSEMPDFDFFPVPDITNALEYAPLQTDAPKDSWFYVELDAEQIEDMIEPFTDDVNAQTPVVTMVDYDIIDVLYMVTEKYVVFEKIGAGSKIHENGKQLMTFNESGATIKRSSFGIDFDGKADAIYEPSSKRVYFSKFSKAKSLFKGFDVFYQDETLDEKAAFLESDLFAVSDFNLNYISLNDTIKIAEIRESQVYDFEDEETRSKIRSYANRYPSAGVSINDEGKVSIGGRKDVSAILKLLEQRFFTSEITGEKLEASRTKRMAR